ncbi:hypothetical protein FISHEDRAFT_22887, partial [Fistulina hepatica ATCC 64428]
RSKSTSPYGRTHVTRRLKRAELPNPVVPMFPQRIVRADGASFTHYTTSPRPFMRLSRDTSNSPIWNTHLWALGDAQDENELTGRLGRFTRRFQEDG